MKTPTASESVSVRLMGEAEPWFEWLQAQRRSPVTIKDYRYGVSRLIRYLDEADIQSLRDVRRPDLERWQRSLVRASLAPITVGCYLHPVICLFAWLEYRGQIFMSPCRDIELPKMPRRLLEVPSENDMRRVLESIAGETPVDLRDRAFLEVIYATGLRRRELAELNVNSVDLTDGVVQVVGKGDKERIGLLTRAAVLATRRYLTDARPMLLGERADDGALWLAEKNGARLTGRMLLGMVIARARAVDLSLTPHAIRRAFATHLLRRGASLVELRRLLGHISFRHLKHYLRYSLQDLRAAHKNSPLGQ